MIVGADATADRAILATSAHALRRLPAEARLLLGLQPDPRCGARPAAEGAAAGARAPALPGRLADALLRLRARGDRRRRRGGMLSLEVDPKLAWALAHRERFPVDLNRAPKELLLRVPGLGVKAVDRMLQARRVRRLRAADLERLHVPLAKVLPFVVVADHRPARAARRADLRRRLAPARRGKCRCSPSRRGDVARRGALTAAWNRANTPPRTAPAGRRRGRAAPSPSRARSTSTAFGAPAARSGPRRSRPPRQLACADDAEGDLFEAARAPPATAAAPARAAGQRAGRLPAALRERRPAPRPGPLRPALPAALAPAERARRCAHDPLDPDWLRRREMAQAVRRDMHKMNAFVRFRHPRRRRRTRRRCTSPGSSRSTTSSRRRRRSSRAASPPCAGRSSRRSAACAGTASGCAFGPGARRDQAPPADAGEELWLTYYRSIFNPARLKLAMMQREMPSSTGATCPRRS